MNEQIQLLRRQVRMVWPYRWVALALAMVISVVGWIYALYVPNVYEVRAKIFVDTTSMLRPLMRGLAIDTSNLASTANLMRRTLLTRPNIEQVARKTDLDLQTKSDREFDLLMADLAKRIELSGTPSDNVYQISFRDSNPQLAKRVVDELLNQFLETALGTTRTDTSTTQKFIDAQIAEYEKRLLDAEQRLKDFKQRNMGLMPGEGSTYYSRLEAAKAALDQARLELSEAKHRRDALRRELEGDEPVFGIMGDYAGSGAHLSSQYDARIAAIEEQLDQMLLQYTEKHPQVIGLRETLTLLAEKRDAELAEAQAALEARGAGASVDLAASPVYAQMHSSVALVQGDVAALESRVEAYQAKVDQLEKAVDIIPEVEAELKRLDRDYGLNRERYLELLSRRESARLSEEVEAQADDSKLKVIEPPRTPLTPVGPERIRYLSLALAAGLVAGGGLAFLLGQINPRFNTSDEVKEVAQVPIIGVVSLVSSGRQQTERRMELAVFSLVLLGMFTFYGALVALEFGQFDLNGKISAIVETLL